MTFGRVMSSNTQQKKPTFPNREYKLFHTSTFTLKCLTKKLKIIDSLQKQGIILNVNYVLEDSGSTWHMCKCIRPKTVT